MLYMITERIKKEKGRMKEKFPRENKERRKGEKQGYIYIYVYLKNKEREAINMVRELREVMKKYKIIKRIKMG